jgi:hypothetical protein
MIYLKDDPIYNRDNLKRTLTLTNLTNTSATYNITMLSQDSTQRVNFEFVSAVVSPSTLGGRASTTFDVYPQGHLPEGEYRTAVKITYNKLDSSMSAAGYVYAILVFKVERDTTKKCPVTFANTGFKPRNWARYNEVATNYSDTLTIHGNTDSVHYTIALDGADTAMFDLIPLFSTTQTGKHYEFTIDTGEKQKYLLVPKLTGVTKQIYYGVNVVVNTIDVYGYPYTTNGCVTQSKSTHFSVLDTLGSLCGPQVPPELCPMDTSGSCSAQCFASADKPNGGDGCCVDSSCKIDTVMLPNINCPNYACAHCPGAGLDTLYCADIILPTGEKIPNINCPYPRPPLNVLDTPPTGYPGYPLPGGGGSHDNPGCAININDTAYIGFYLPGGGGSDDDGDGIPNFNELDWRGACAGQPIPHDSCAFHAFFEPGGGGDTCYCGHGIPNVNCDKYPGYYKPGGGGYDGGGYNGGDYDESGNKHPDAGNGTPNRCNPEFWSCHRPGGGCLQAIEISDVNIGNTDYGAMSEMRTLTIHNLSGRDESVTISMIGEKVVTSRGDTIDVFTLSENKLVSTWTGKVSAAQNATVSVRTNPMVPVKWNAKKDSVEEYRVAIVTQQVGGCSNPNSMDTAYLTATILPYSISQCSSDTTGMCIADSIPIHRYNGQEQKPIPELHHYIDTSDVYDLQDIIDMNLAYSNNKLISSGAWASVTVRGVNNYKDSLQLIFEIIKGILKTSDFEYSHNNINWYPAPMNDSVYYDEQPKIVNVRPNTNLDGVTQENITKYYYYKYDTTMNEWVLLDIYPLEVGRYMVRIDVEETEFYEGTDRLLIGEFWIVTNQNPGDFEWTDYIYTKANRLFMFDKGRFEADSGVSIIKIDWYQQHCSDFPVGIGYHLMASNVYDMCGTEFIGEEYHDSSVYFVYVYASNRPYRSTNHMFLKDTIIAPMVSTQWVYPTILVRGEVLHIIVPEGLEFQNLEIVSVTGQQVYKRAIGGAPTLNLNIDLSPGNYFVRVEKKTAKITVVNK